MRGFGRGVLDGIQRLGEAIRSPAEVAAGPIGEATFVLRGTFSTIEGSYPPDFGGEVELEGHDRLTITWTGACADYAMDGVSIGNRCPWP